MRKANVDVFSFDELSEEAKERAHRDWVDNGLPYCWADEARKVIEAFEKEFNVTVRNWHYSSWDYDFSLDTSRIDDDVLELKGNRARSWFWNNHPNILLSPTVRYFTRDRNGKRIEAVGIDSKKFVSKVSTTRVYDGTCPWTGWCFDCDAIDPIAYFCFGVEWSEKERKRVPSCRKLAIDNDNTVDSLLREGLCSLFYSLKKDCEYQESMEAFKETCEANDYEFTEDGKMWFRARESS